MKMILMNDFLREPLELIESQKKAVESVLKGGWYILGPKVKTFEDEWARYLSSPHAIGVGNGMDAIEIGLKAIELPPDSEVITTPLTAFATVLAILRAGLRPVLADIDPTTGILDLESVARSVTNNTRAILLVHLYGRAADMGQWQKLAREKKLLLLEDCAQSHGASWNGTNVGNFGIFAAWSFYPTKNLGALGDGGAITTGDAHLAEKIKQLRNYGQSKRYHHPLVGLNSRLDEIQAAILSERLKWLDRFTERRREIANAYRDGIDNPEITLLAPPRDPNGHVHHLFVIKTKRREAFISHLESKGVASLIHYPVPVHNQEPCVNLRLDPKGLSNCEAFSKECVSLPIHPQLSDEDVSIVISAVNSFC